MANHGPGGVRDLLETSMRDSRIRPDLDDLAQRRRRLERRRTVSVALVILVAVAGVGVALAAIGRGTTRSPRASGLSNAHQVPSQIKPGANPLVSGRILLQTASAASILTPSNGQVSPLNAAGAIAIYGFDPTGSSIAATLQESEPSGITRGTQLLKVDAASGAETVLVQAAATDSLGNARWSPDGSVLAYIDTRWSQDPNSVFPGDPQAQAICGYMFATSTARCFPQAGTIYDFDWSPSSSTVAVTGSGDQPISLLDVNTGNVSTLVPAGGSQSLTNALQQAGLGAPTSFSSPRWSKSGRYLAVEAQLVVGGVLAVVFDSSGNFVALGEANDDSIELAWNPVQDYLAYTRGVNGFEPSPPPWSVYLLDPTTKLSSQLISTDSLSDPQVLGLRWSPSGLLLALDDTNLIRIVDLSGAIIGTNTVSPEDMTRPLVDWTA